MSIDAATLGALHATMVSLGPTRGMGIGLYTPAQAAMLARVRPQTMARWIHGSGRSSPAVRAQLAGDREKTVTFLDLVQSLALRAIRLERKVPLQKLRRFVELAETKYGISYPFARPHTTYLFNDDIVLRHGDSLIQLTGRYKHQDLIRPVAEFYMLCLSFTDGLASEYRAYEYQDRSIVINPHNRFGQPMVSPCGYSVKALVDSVRAEGSIEEAARVNDVAIADVYTALRYEDHLRGIAS
jgi:uncharacterized protein (DUF433 family)